MEGRCWRVFGEILIFTDSGGLRVVFWCRERGFGASRSSMDGNSFRVEVLCGVSDGFATRWIETIDFG